MTELKDDKELNEFRVGEILFKGEVADIWGGVHSSTGTPVHVVIVNKRKIGQAVDELRIERYAPKVREITNPHVLKYHRMVQNEIQMGIIMEHPKGGSVRDYLLLKNEKRISEPEARVLFKQIVSALDSLHTLQIVHGGINLKNVFVDDTLIPPFVKVGDFLICSRLGLHKSHSANSCHFFPPEMWSEGNNELPSDIWCLGVLLYVMVCGCYPFDGKNEIELIGCIRKGVFNIPQFISDECAHLIKSMLNPVPSERPTMPAIRNHPWISEISNSESSAPGSPLNSSSPIVDSSHRKYSLDNISEEHLPSSPTLTNAFLEKMKLGENEHTSIDNINNNIDYNSDSDSVKSEDFSTTPTAFQPPFSDPIGRKKKSELIEIAHRNNMKVHNLDPLRGFSAPNSPTEFTPAFPESFDYQYKNISDNNRNLSISTTSSRTNTDTSVIQSPYFLNLIGLTNEDGNANNDRSIKKSKSSPPASPKVRTGRRPRRRSFDSSVTAPYQNKQAIPALQGINEAPYETPTPSLVSPTVLESQQPLRHSTSVDSASKFYGTVMPTGAPRTDFDNIFVGNAPTSSTQSFNPVQLQRTQQQLQQLLGVQNGTRSLPNMNMNSLIPPQQRPLYPSHSAPLPGTVQVNTIQIPSRSSMVNPVQVHAPTDVQSTQQNIAYLQQLLNQHQRMAAQTPSVQPQPQPQVQAHHQLQVQQVVQPPQQPKPTPQTQPQNQPQDSPQSFQDFLEQFSLQNVEPSQSVFELSNLDIDNFNSIMGGEDGEAMPDNWVNSVLN